MTGLQPNTGQVRVLTQQLVLRAAAQATKIGSAASAYPPRPKAWGGSKILQQAWQIKTEELTNLEAQQTKEGR